MSKQLLFCILFLYSAQIFANTDYQTCQQNRECVNFIQALHRRDGFDRQWLSSLFSKLRIPTKAAQNTQKPLESRPWFQYKKLFVTPKLACRGAHFWEQHQKVLNQVERQYHVPAAIIIAIIGIESGFGRNQGHHPVFKTLATLAFTPWRRQDYFQSQLRHLLLLARDNHLNIKHLHGSYAGALGQVQFMPSTYRTYAVDFDHKGYSDLFHNTHDIIASVAHFLKAHHWHYNQMIAAPVHTTQRLKSYRPSFHHAYALQTLGINLNSNKHPQRAYLLKLKQPHRWQYWLAFHNFKVIAHYNPSIHYSMAVYQLAKKIKTFKSSKNVCQ